MTISFRDFLKKWTDRFRPVQSSTKPGAPRSFAPTTSKATGERLSKTVMPNTTRSTSSDFLKAAGDSAPNVRAAAMRILPPTVALALQPKVERAISLQLSDVVDHVPAGFLKPVESFDIAQTILLKASEIEKGMSDDKPVASLFSIYEQIPDIFLRTVRPDDATQVPVPHAKVLEQLRRMQIRDDQETESAVPQVDTPILKVTIEDTQRFGTTIPMIQTSDHPPVKVEPATARTLSNAEPEAAASEEPAPAPARAGGPIPLTTLPKLAPRPSAPDPISPARISFKLPPKGADEPALQRVPASSSSSAPPSVPTPTSANRIPFKMTPPNEALKPKLQIVPGVTAAETAEKKAPASTAPPDAKISLGLRPVVQNMPSFQLHRSAESVAPEARIELPLGLVESQLASGRIAVPIKLFREALPADYKELVIIDATESPVMLPLQEVLKNLSPDTLKMRDDQVADELAEGFETPFSIKAAEDAKRFTAPPEEETPTAPAIATAAPVKTPEAKQPDEVTKPEAKEHAKAPEISKASEAKPEVAQLPEAKQPEVAKALQVKLPEAAKAPEAKQPEPAKLPETKPLELAKAPQVKLPEVAKAPEAKQPEPVKLPETKPLELAKAPPVKQPESAKSEAEKPALTDKPTAPTAPLVLKLAPQSSTTPKPVIDTNPVEAQAQAPVVSAVKASQKPAENAEPAPKLKLETPNEAKSSVAPVKAAAKAEQKPEINTNAKAVVEQANALPGVAGSAVLFEDGLSLAGQLPEDVQAGGLCAMAPSILQRVNRHTADTKFGPLVSMTLSCRNSELSFFMTGNVCLAALHSQPVLPAETHRQLAEKTAELSRIYAQPGEKHVDH